MSDPWMNERKVLALEALAEQQRIANLIALHRHEVEYDIGGWSRLYEHGTETLKPDIARALRQPPTDRKGAGR